MQQNGLNLEPSINELLVLNVKWWKGTSSLQDNKEVTRGLKLLFESCWNRPTLCTNKNTEFKFTSFFLLEISGKTAFYFKYEMFLNNILLFKYWFLHFRYTLSRKKKQKQNSHNILDCTLVYKCHWFIIAKYMDKIINIA